MQFLLLVLEQHLSIRKLKQGNALDASLKAEAQNDIEFTELQLSN